MTDTTDTTGTPPLTVEFDVEASPEHAFTTWVERIDMWWPRGHTVSGSPAAIVFEPRAGGRIFERDAHGAEIAWGEVTVWDPPLRVEYLWHIFFPRADATRVAVTFAAGAHGATTVRIVQTGWDELGPAATARREGNTRGWAAVTPEFRHYLGATKEGRS